MTDLLLTGIGRLVTNSGPPLHDAEVAIENGRIIHAGTGGDAPSQGSGERIDCEGRTVIPGFVDAHTHLVFAGDRADEFAGRLAGAGYTGGGILSTVAATRAAPEEDLFREVAGRVRRMIAGGTTTVEVKSGYGLQLDTELRMLRVARRLAAELPITVRTTFLGAHTVPGEFGDDPGGYVDLVVEEMLPVVASEADYCDVFVEEGAFDVDQARRILKAAAAHGLAARVHAEQLTHSGGARLAAELGAMSADHLDLATEEDAEALAGAGVSAVLTPGASYSLRKPQAPGPMLLDHGVIVALATDCNPGTSYFESMGPVISLACVQMGLTVQQAVFAATRGGAIALGLDDHGVLEPGAVGDLVILDAPSESHLAYRPATNLVWKTIKDGAVVVG
ncbi:MAG TPA: imidazolonepropionase [Acidimicrobiia bacterium]|nr:imidazolonepropionase [Acidimicrobiia bacterium]